MRYQSIFHFLITGTLCLLATGCDRGNSYKEGGFRFDQIYVYEDGSLIDAQDFVVEFPAEGGSIEKEFVTYGITELREVNRVDGISAEFLSSYPPPDDELYEAGQYLSRYKQTIRFEAKPNNEKKSLEAKIMIVTAGYNGYAAYVNIKQSSAI